MLGDADGFSEPERHELAVRVAVAVAEPHGLALAGRDDCVAVREPLLELQPQRIGDTQRFCVDVGDSLRLAEPLVLADAHEQLLAEPVEVAECDVDGHAKLNGHEHAERHDHAECERDSERGAHAVFDSDALAG